MQRIFVYAHDAYGMGNTRRMTAIASYLANAYSGVNVLLASGSPVLQGFRLPDRVDYIKLPSVARTMREQYATRYLTTEIADTIHMRAALLRTAVADFAPDVVLVDKKPFGIMRELRPALACLRGAKPAARIVLVLRDILDDPERTVPSLLASGFERDVNRWFDHIVVLGSRDLFDLGREYHWSPQTISKTTYCGYLRTPAGARGRREVRDACGATGADDRLVLVTSGGGEDGATLLSHSVEALALLGQAASGSPRTHALVVTGPHAPKAVVERLRSRARDVPGVTVREFTDDMASYVQAADVMVSMGGYNTVCDILSHGRRAVVVPRTDPVREQWIRAERMAQRGLLSALHPDALSPTALAAAIELELGRATTRRPSRPIDLDGLPHLAGCLERVMRPPAAPVGLPMPAPRRLREAPLAGAVR